MLVKKIEFFSRLLTVMVERHLRNLALGKRAIVLRRAGEIFRRRKEQAAKKT